MLTGGFVATILALCIGLGWAIMHIFDLKAQLKDEAVMRQRLIDELNERPVAPSELTNMQAPALSSSSQEPSDNDEPITPTTEHVETLKNTAQIMKEADIPPHQNEFRNWDDV